jgi:GDP-L-fucose synthase
MKTVLITGCSGLVGTYLIKHYINRNYDVNSEKYKIIGVDISDLKIKINYEHFTFEKVDLIDSNNIINLFDKYQPDLVINAFGIKGSPIKAKTHPVDFLYPSFKINTEIINQCYKRDVWLVFMSSVGVYAPAEKFVEDDVWKTLPSEHDWFPSWSKRTGELLLEAYKVQYGYNKWSIIRPANIFGSYDNFGDGSTVIASTIKKIHEAKDKIVCWGDGSSTRDFVFGKDVANAVSQLYEHKINDIVNFGSGIEITIKSMVESLVKVSGKNLTIEWDTTKPNGDLRRQMDTTKQEHYNLLPKTNFDDALDQTYSHYVSQFIGDELSFNVTEFLEKGFHVGKTNEIFGEDKTEFYDKINELQSISTNCDHYGYRLDYKIPNHVVNDYKLHISGYEIIEREQLIKENNGQIGQRWWEVFTKDDTPIEIKMKFLELKNYFQEKTFNYLKKIYPKLNKDNIVHHDNFTLYENGDFIEPHSDGYNLGRYCVVLIYLSYEKDYNDGGGKLMINDNGFDECVVPINENFSILDFTQNNPVHSVEPVKNDFRRFTYIDFVYNKTETKN